MYDAHRAPTKKAKELGIIIGPQICQISPLIRSWELLLAHKYAKLAH